MTDLLKGLPGSIRCPGPNQDPVEFDAAPTVTVVSDSTGITLVDEETATVVGDEYKVTVPAQDEVDGLVATWTGEIDGAAASIQTFAEIIGSHIIGITAIKKDLEQVDIDPMPDDAAIADARELAEHRLEDACGVAFRPRYARAQIDATDHATLLLPRPRLLKVLSIDGEASDVPASVGGEISRDSGVWTGTFNVAWVHGYTDPPAAVIHAVRLLCREYLMVDPDDLDNRATFKSNEIASWSLVTPGQKGATFPIPEVNEIVKEFGYLQSVA